MLFTKPILNPDDYLVDCKDRLDTLRALMSYKRDVVKHLREVDEEIENAMHRCHHEGVTENDRYRIVDRVVVRRYVDPMKFQKMYPDIFMECIRVDIGTLESRLGKMRTDEVCDTYETKSKTVEVKHVV
jgi:hypothetical protein